MEEFFQGPIDLLREKSLSCVINLSLDYLCGHIRRMEKCSITVNLALSTTLCKEDRVSSVAVSSDNIPQMSHAVFLPLPVRHIQLGHGTWAKRSLAT